MYDIIIIGAGPAGLSAAIYAKRASKKVLVLEAQSYGGAIINTLNIENYPVESHISGFDFATKLYNQVKEMNVEIKFEKVLKLKNNDNEKLVVTGNESYQTRTIIIATGSTYRKLGIENEDNFVGKGISYCATCDGNFYKHKKVGVIGGGNTALEDALYLSNVANIVYLIHRKSEFRGDEVTLTQLRNSDNVKIITDNNVTKLIGDSILKSIELTNNNGDISILDVDGLFVAIGRIPETEIFDNLVELDKDGYIKTNEDCHTSVLGIYAAGDIRSKSLRQLVTATADGAVAATEAIKYINNNEMEEENV